MRRRDFFYPPGTLAAREALQAYHRELELETYIPFYFLLSLVSKTFRKKYSSARWELWESLSSHPA